MATITYLTTVQFGFGELKTIAPGLTDLKIARPLIVADRGLAATDLIQRLRAASPLLGNAPLFVDTPTNPTEEAVEAALALYREHDCDGLVAIGGGSPIDLAKGVALLAGHDGPLETYAAILGGIPKVTGKVAPVMDSEFALENAAEAHARMEGSTHIGKIVLKI